MSDVDIQSASTRRSVRFNQDGRCVAVACADGFRIYSTDPLVEIFHRKFDTGFNVVEMLYTSNILALVGDGTNPLYAPHKVILWNDFQKTRIDELSFASPVLDVRLRHDFITVVLASRVYVYAFDDLRLCAQIDANASRGTVAVSAGGPPIIALLGDVPGSVAVHDYSVTPPTVRTVRAHDHPIAIIQLSPDGRFVATASQRGTIIRVFSAADAAIRAVGEYRRGNDAASITALAFSPDSMHLACVSDHGTIHVFSLEAARRAADRAAEQNVPRTSFGATERAFAKYSLKTGRGATALAWGATPGTVLAVTPSGGYEAMTFGYSGSGPAVGAADAEPGRIGVAGGVVGTVQLA